MDVIDLEDVTVDFTANVADLVSKMELAIETVKEFQGAVDEATLSVEALHLAIDDLPAEHVTDVRLEGEDEVLEQVAYIRELIGEGLPEEKTILINVATSGGDAGDTTAAAEAIAHLDDEEVRLAADTIVTGETIRRLSDAQIDAINSSLGLAEAQRVLGDAVTDTAAKEALAAAAADGQSAAWGRIGEAGRDFSESMIQTIADANETSGALDRVFSVAGDGVANVKSATEAVGDFNAGLERLPHYATDLETSIKETGDAADILGQSVQDNLDRGFLSAFQATQTLDNGLKALKDSAKDAGDAAKDAGAAAGDTTWSWLSLTHNIQTFGGALQMVFKKDIPMVTSIAGWHLLLDSVAEGVIAVSGALIALGAGAAGMAPSMLDIYNHLVSTRDVIESFGAEVRPFNSFFLNLQHSMQTDSIELYGEALLDLGKANNGLATSIQNVGGDIDRMGAKISEWVGSNTDFAGTIAKGAQYAKDFGDILGNLIVIIDELIRADSGVVGAVLEFFGAFTHAIAAVLGFSEALDRVLLLGHGILLWGGLLSSMLINISLMFLRPLANIVAFVGGVQGAGAAIKEFEVANDAAATPIQKIGIVFQTLASSIGNIAGNIKTWAVGIGTSMEEAEGVTATAAAGMKAALLPVGDALAGLLASPAAIAAVAAALGYAAYEGMQATAGAKSFGSAIQQAINNDTASQAITGITDSIGALDEKISTTTPQSMEKFNDQVQSFGLHFQATGYAIDAAGASFGKAIAAVPESLSSWPALGKTVMDFGHAFKEMATGDGAASQAAAVSINYYKGLITGLSSSQKTLFQVAGATMKENGVSFVQALGLMDAAGIKSGESFKEDMTQVEGLIAGYKNLGIQGGLLGNSINAITFSTELQESKISAITGAWTTFINLVTGGESTFVTVAQQLAGTLSAAGGAASTLSISNGKVTDSIKDASAAAGGAKVNIDALSTAGLALKSSFIQTIQSMSGNLNSLMELSSAAGSGTTGLHEISQAGKDYVASLLPMAKGSQDATATLYALAQQAGYTGSDSFASLAKWVGNIKDPMEQAESITDKMTMAAGNLAKDVTDLANAIDTSLNSAMALAIMTTNKTQTAFNNAATAIHNAHGNITDMLPSVKTLGESIYQDLGGNLQQTNAELTTFMNAMGLTPSQIKAILARIDGSFAQSASNIDQSLNTIQGRIDALHGKNISITESVEQTVSQAGAIPVGVGTHNAAGWLVPGYGGGDIHPALLEGGEAVVPKELTPAVAPFLSAHGVPGFTGGGYAGGWYDSGYMPGLFSAPSGGSSGGSSGGAPVTEVHLHGDLARQDLWDNMQVKTLQYNFRNSGKPTGAVKPS